MQDSSPGIVRLSEYRPPPFLIDTVDLRFELAEDGCVIRSVLGMRRNRDLRPDASDAPLVLDGQELDLLEVSLDGRRLAANEYRVDPEHLVLERVPAQFTLEVCTRIEPHRNTALEGLYKSRGMFCTQCEAEGFRKITYYLDRPDVMARFTTTIVADPERYPVLLSNGNRTAGGALEDGRHWARWEDPFPKPCYLFALVAGDLRWHEDAFVTRSGREVALRIFVEAHNLGKCAHAMASLKRAMRWDEEVYGLEYDLDTFMIVAVDDFNMGAMENKGLNIFNSKYVLADPATATDSDYRGIESVIAHEYFHNWTGNRVTCRDWFQLSLKEGLTVFRDQEFSSDVGSRALTRIGDVRGLRTAQFKEDAGPTAHPVRPSSYLEINNFYTVTVYNKGAEVVRMIHRILGPERFRAGIDLYFDRHDGQAVTTDDFVAAMESASGVELEQFRRWYEQAGTPVIGVETAYDPGRSRFSLTLSQSCAETPDGSPKQPFHIPVAVGLLDAEGRAVPLAGSDEETGTVLLELRRPRETFHFDRVPDRPVASVLRGFSAPVRLDFPRAERELAFLLGADPDPFNRWDAGQEYAMRLLLRTVDEHRRGRTSVPDHAFLDALGAMLTAPGLDRALAAEMLTLPSESYVAEQMRTVDPDAVHEARQWLRREIARHLRAELDAAFRACRSNAPYRYDVASVADRSLRNVALGYLMELEEPAVRSECESQFRDADNMTDRIAALTLLAQFDTPERIDALARFEREWHHDPLVLDKWFSIQAQSPLPRALADVTSLLRHPGYDRANPNRVRALVGAFCHGNQVRFHDPSGSGYRFAAEQLIGIDALNPQVAARLASAFLRWRKFDAGRQRLMESEIRRVLATPRLSKDCLEILSKALA